MQKRQIIILGILFGGVILCLVGVQIYWLKEAYTTKEKQFDQLVLKALADISYKIEQEETYELIIDEVFPGQTSEINQPKPDSGNISSGADNTSASRTPNSNNSDNTDSIIRIIKNQVEQLEGHNPNNRQLIEKQNYINRILLRMFSHRKEIEARLTPNELEAVIDETLHDYDIYLDYNYAVTKWNTTIAFKSKLFKPETVSSVYRVKLFPEDFYSQENFLHIHFPNRRNYIIRSLGFMGLSTGIITLFIAVTFAITLYYIFREKKLSEVKNDFVNNMTHELKTPISTISLASQMLGDGSIPDSMKNTTRISDIITQESKRLGYLVEKVLQMATIDKGNLILRAKEVDFHEVIESVAGNFVLQVENRGGLLIPSLHADETWVNVDPTHMANVISNLLDNAVKYTEKTPEIYIETASDHNLLTVSVKDNGIGISKANQKKIFEKFFRVPTGNIHNVKGFGLGLNYVKRIIEEHQGTLTVDSEPGKGTKISFTIPLVNTKTNQYGNN